MPARDVPWPDVSAEGAESNDLLVVTVQSEQEDL